MSKFRDEDVINLFTQADKLNIEVDPEKNNGV